MEENSSKTETFLPNRFACLCLHVFAVKYGSYIFLFNYLDKLLSLLLHLIITRHFYFELAGFITK